MTFDLDQSKHAAGSDYVGQFGGSFGNAGFAVSVAIVCSFGQYFGQLAPFGLSSSSCAQSSLLSQFEQQRWRSRITAGSILVGSSRSVSSRRLSRSAALWSRVARTQRSAAEIPRSCAMRATSNGLHLASSLTAALFCQKDFPASTNRLSSPTTRFDRGSDCIMAFSREPPIANTAGKIWF